MTISDNVIKEFAQDNSQKIKYPIGCAEQREAHRFIGMMRFTIVVHIL